MDKGRDVAFIPDPLPGSWEIPPDLVPVWAEAREVLGELRGTGRTLPDPGLLLRPLRQREAIRSSSLEGIYATPEELLAYEMNPRDPRSAQDPANAWREVSNYQSALEKFGKPESISARGIDSTRPLQSISPPFLAGWKKKCRPKRTSIRWSGP